MKLSQFKFNLPEELIAKYPAKYRDESRLMVLHKRSGEIEHRIFKEILEYFKARANNHERWLGHMRREQARYTD